MHLRKSLESFGSKLNPSKFLAAASLFSALTFSHPAVSQTNFSNAQDKFKQLGNQKVYFEQIPHKNKSQTEQYISVLKDLGNWYQESGYISNALELYQQAQIVCDQNGYFELSLDIQNNIACLYGDNLGQYAKALDVYLHIFEQQKKIPNYNKKKMVSIILNIEQCYWLLRKYDQAVDYLNQAENMLDGLDYHRGEIQFLHYKADYLKYLKKYEEAESFYKKAFLMAKASGDFYMQKYISESITNLHKKIARGDSLGSSHYPSNSLTSSDSIKILKSQAFHWKSAFQQDKITDQINDTLINIEMAKQIGELQRNFEIQTLSYTNKMQQDSLKITNFELLGKEQENKIQKDSLLTKNLLIKNKNIELENQEKEIEIQKKNALISGLGAAVAAIFGAVLTFFYVKLKKKNKIIEESREVISEQNEELVTQNEVITRQKRELDKSIEYAKKIQDAIVLDTKLSDVFSESYIFYKAKDCISGDFYYSGYAQNGLKFFVLADCTGHGVPGALMSIYNKSLLAQALSVSSHGPQILDDLDQKFKDLHDSSKTRSSISFKDAMDAIICFVDEEKDLLYYAGSGRPLRIVRNGEILIYNPPKGKKLAEEGFPGFVSYTDEFNKNETISSGIPLYEGDMIYAFSDGIIDQSGGPDGKSMGSKKLKSFLLKHSHLSPEQQNLAVEKFFSDWKGSLEQRDDVAFLGVRYVSKKNIVSQPSFEFPPSS